MIETQLLLDENITPAGKDLTHSLMVKDHHDALKYILLLTDPFPINIKTIQEINARAMKNTGSVFHTALGNFDSNKGDLRRGNVSVGQRIFPNYDKVIPLLNQLIENVNKSISEANDHIRQYELSFRTHFDLVSIHLFIDGNGRTSRLFMNMVQHYFKLPLSLVFKQDRKDYFESLEKARNEKNIDIFYSFMFQQLNKHLSNEINNFNKKDNSLFLSFL